MSELLEPGAVDRLRHVSASSLYDDDPEWLDLVVDQFGGHEEQLVERFAERLAPRTLRTFHGTRTADAGSFLNEGIRLHERQHLEEYVRRLVEDHASIHWIRPSLDQRFAETAHLIDEGRCFVVVDERVLVEQCGHYLLGGSEFLQGIIGPHRAHEALDHCAPTVIEIDLPLGRVLPSQLTEFARTLLGEWAKVLRRHRSQPRHLDFTFVLREPVPPAWVVGHYHPLVVNDPHERRAPVQTKWPYCAVCTLAPETST